MVNKVNKWILAIAIAIVFNLFINYGVETFYPGPEYSDYCGNNYRELFAKPILHQQNFTCPDFEANETAREVCAEDKNYILPVYDSNSCAVSEFCNTCQIQFDGARDTREGNVFLFLVVFALILLGAGLALKKSEAVSAGLLLAGILDLVIASTRYWGHLQNIARFLLLGVVLAILIWLGYKKVK